MFAERKTYTSTTLLNMDTGAKLELQADVGGYSVSYTVNGSVLVLEYQAPLSAAAAAYQRFRRELTAKSRVLVVP